MTVPGDAVPQRMTAVKIADVEVEAPEVEAPRRDDVMNPPERGEAAPSPPERDDIAPPNEGTAGDEGTA